MQTQQSNHQGLERWTTAMQQICGRFETELASNHSLFIGEVSTFSRGGCRLPPCAPMPATSAGWVTIRHSTMTSIAFWSVSVRGIRR